MNTAPFTLSQVKKFLQKQEQEHLYHILTSLDPQQQHSLLSELAQLSHELPKDPLIPHIETVSTHSLTPFTNPVTAHTDLEPKGKQALIEGSVLAILLAGGDGTRLGFNQPKGSFPTSCVMKKSLFQLQCERLLALQKQLNCKLSLALLTSPTNHRTTLSYFEQHEFFGIHPSQILFLIQPTLPLYTIDHKWLLKTPNQLSMAPNGNGGLLTALHNNSHLLSRYHYFTVINIDNALANPYDIPLISTHIHHEADMSLRCFKQDHTKEHVGVLAYSQNRLLIIDYTAIKDRSIFPYGNINTLCFSKTFLESLSKKPPLPIHWIQKQGSCYNPTTHTYQTIPVLKGERFLSDTVALADKVIALDSLAEDHFAPLKNLHGLNDLTAVHRALLHKDHAILESLTGLKSTAEMLELAMEFHHPDQALIQKCKTLKKWPENHYLSPDML